MKCGTKSTPLHPTWWRCWRMQWTQPKMPQLGRISNTPAHARVMSLKCWQCGKPNNRSTIGSDIILGFYIGPNSSLQNRLVRWAVPLSTNYNQVLSFINMGLGFFPRTFIQDFPEATLLWNTFFFILRNELTNANFVTSWFTCTLYYKLSTFHV